MATDDVSKTTHIYSSKSADQLISAKGNKEFIPSKIYEQINKKPELSYNSPKHGNKSKKIINNLAL
jgi:hypothetical protein